MSGQEPISGGPHHSIPMLDPFPDGAPHGYTPEPAWFDRPAAITTIRGSGLLPFQRTPGGVQVPSSCEIGPGATLFPLTMLLMHDCGSCPPRIMHAV
jgi:hypothetical protein